MVFFSFRMCTDDDASYYLTIAVFILVSVLYLFYFNYIIFVIDLPNFNSIKPPPTLLVVNAQASGDTSPASLMVGNGHTPPAGLMVGTAHT